MTAGDTATIPVTTIPPRRMTTTGTMTIITAIATMTITTAIAIMIATIIITIMTAIGTTIDRSRSIAACEAELVNVAHAVYPVLVKRGSCP